MAALTNGEWDRVCRELIGNEQVRSALKAALVRIGCDGNLPMTIHNASFGETPALIIAGVAAMPTDRPEYLN